MGKGLLVSQVKSGSSAEKAGLKGGTTAVRYGRSTFYIGGDIIVAVDGMAVGSIADLHTALEDNKPGEKVQVEYFRGKQRAKALVVLDERPQER
ncbi:MAG: peptidase S1 and S6 chymotrypsin/Hap [Spirochaetes bacterium]|nr:MAG: peptidase S1 and S6 chymotrypsin/Hap [Spirochaetota bacterium]